VVWLEPCDPWKAVELRIAGLNMFEMLAWSGNVGESLRKHIYLFLKFT